MSLRHPQILALARREGRVTVEDLSERFGVSLQTVRRDLGELAEAGRLQRVHGGAVLSSGTTNLAHADRRAMAAEAKAAIGRAAAARIPEGASLFLGIGTTTEAVAEALTGHGRLLVVTNNLNVAEILSDGPAEIVVTGGRLRSSDGGLTGAMAAEGVARFRPDWAVFGCSALDPDGTMLDFDAEEASVTQAAIRAARRTMLVADGGKFARTAPLRLGPLRDVDVFVTDQALTSSGLTRACENWNVEVRVAS
ncbi:MAG: DeoR/GlpR family DNA-binding transcription regulator [Pseudomonadota bacterium]